MADSVAAARAAWASVLGQDPIDDEDNFFEAGGDSLSALELITILSDELGIGIPMAEFYRAPTFGGLVRLLADDASANVPTAHHATGRTLVRLRRGGAGRLWCFLPPLSGAVTRYAQMPRLLPAGDAVWAMETPAGLSGAGMAPLIRGLAARLRAEDLSGFRAIVLSGYSLGGVFAHELARELGSRPGGPLVAALLLDPPDPAEFRPSPGDAFDIFVRVGWRIPRAASSFVAANGTFQLGQVAAAARAAGTLPAAASDDEVRDAWTVYASNARILDGHVITPGVDLTFLLRCDAGADAPPGGWVTGAPAKGAWVNAVRPAQVSVLRADHFAMMEPPNDEVVGRWLVSTADQALSLAGVP
jgi:acyl carrier protein/thioesterase domain-containing protein